MITTKNPARYIGLVMALLLGPTLSANAQSRLDFNTDNLQINWRDVRAGGPPKDGIPALTRPAFDPVQAAGYLRDEDRVVVVEVEGDTRGYPFSILNWHEAVNDVVGGVPLAVIYCPLCDSVSVVDRRIQGDTLEFGISGLLYESNVLLYDRTHNALWSQVGFEAVSGPYAGQSLKHQPWSIMRFDTFRKQHPEAHVLSIDTGHQRNYAQNPYQHYFESGRLMFPVSRRDRRLQNKEPIIGIRIGDTARAYRVADIIDAPAPGGRVEDAIQGQPLVLKADQQGTIQIITLPDGAQAVHTFWFTWSALHRDTEVHLVK